jgi:molybdate transport system ATP-binding protein
VPTADRGLDVSGLTARAGSFTLGPVNLHIPPDRVLVVLGPSGAGKTMLLETIAGLRPQNGGQINLAGADITCLPPERRRIGLVFQDAALFPHLTVQQNVEFGPRATGAAATKASVDLLHQLGVGHLAPRAPRSLSGGERQRIALARALAIQPALLLLDEPLSALDQPTREDLRTLLRRLLAELNIPTAYVTHDRDEALSIGDDLAVIVRGQLRQTGPAATVSAQPADPDVARLLGWSELGYGTAANDTIRIGNLALRVPAITGPVQAFYRPEDIQFGPPGHDEPVSASFMARVEQIVHTRPLARITLGTNPPITALMLHRDIGQLQLTIGEPTPASLREGSLRIFQAGEIRLPTQPLSMQKASRRLPPADPTNSPSQLVNRPTGTETSVTNPPGGSYRLVAGPRPASSASGKGIESTAKFSRKIAWAFNLCGARRPAGSSARTAWSGRPLLLRYKGIHWRKLSRAGPL